MEEVWVPTEFDQGGGGVSNTADCVSHMPGVELHARCEVSRYVLHQLVNMRVRRSTATAWKRSGCPLSLTGAGPDTGGLLFAAH
jgi:hypothetical protein